MKSIAQALAQGTGERDVPLSFSSLMSMLANDHLRQGEGRDARADRARADALLACLVLSPRSPAMVDDDDQDRVALSRRLFDLRDRHLAPKLEGAAVRAGSYRSDRGLVRLEWLLADDTPWHMVANFGATQVTTGDVPQGSVVYRDRVTDTFGGTIELEAGGVKVVSVAAHGARDARQRRA